MGSLYSRFAPTVAQVAGFFATGITSCAVVALFFSVTGSLHGPEGSLLAALIFGFLPFGACLPTAMIVSAVPCILSLLVPAARRRRAAWRHFVVGALTGSLAGSAVLVLSDRSVIGEDEPTKWHQFVHCLQVAGLPLAGFGAVMGLFYWWITGILLEKEPSTDW